MISLVEEANRDLVHVNTLISLIIVFQTLIQVPAHTGRPPWGRLWQPPPGGASARCPSFRPLLQSKRRSRSPLQQLSHVSSLRCWPLTSVSPNVTIAIATKYLNNIWQCNVRLDCQADKAGSSSREGEGQTTPTSSQQTNHSQPAPPFFTPEPSLRRANGLQATLNYDSPVQGAPPSSTAGGVTHNRVEGLIPTWCLSVQPRTQHCELVLKTHS